MEIFVITTNEGKFKEIAFALKESGITAIQKEFESPETKETLEEISEQKARAAYEQFKHPLVVDDTGIFFSDYENFPGPRAKRAYQELGYEGLLKKLEGTSRKASFKTVIAYIDNTQAVTLFSGEITGTMAESLSQAQVHKGLPYDKLFIPDGKQVPFGELSEEEKNHFSHRAIATRKLAEFLKSQSKN